VAETVKSDTGVNLKFLFRHCDVLLILKILSPLEPPRRRTGLWTFWSKGNSGSASKKVETLKWCFDVILAR
jgi:hypothetical protein